MLLAEVFAGYYGQRLPAAVPYRRFIDWLADRDVQAARRAWREELTGFDTPTLVGPPDLGVGPRSVTSLRVSVETTRALNELARSHHTTVSTVLQAAWTQLLMSMTGQSDVAFGVVVAGRPAEVAGADSMLGLLINTVPLRVSISPTPPSPTCSISCRTPGPAHSSTSISGSTRSTGSLARRRFSTPSLSTRTIPPTRPCYRVRTG